MAFANIVNQADEIGKAGRESGRQATTARKQQTNVAAATPSFDFTVEAKKVKLNYQNLKQVRVNYYLMDIELLFSRNPFVQGEAKQFSNILPNHTQTIKLPAKGATFEFPLPREAGQQQRAGRNRRRAGRPIAGLLLQRAGRADGRKLRPSAGDAATRTARRCRRCTSRSTPG